VKDVDLTAAVVVCLANWLSIFSALIRQDVCSVAYFRTLKAGQQDKTILLVGFTAVLRIRVCWLTVQSFWMKVLMPSRL
jgi:hypothetical protein